MLTHTYTHTLMRMSSQKLDYKLFENGDYITYYIAQNNVLCKYCWINIKLTNYTSFPAILSTTPNAQQNHNSRPHFTSQLPCLLESPSISPKWECSVPLLCTHNVITAITLLLSCISEALPLLDCRDEDHIVLSVSLAPYQLQSGYSIDLVKYKGEWICLSLVLTLVAKISIQFQLIL